MGLRKLLSHPHPRESASDEPQSTTSGRISGEEEADWAFLSQWSTEASPAQLQRGPRGSGNVLGTEQNPFANTAGHLSDLKLKGVYIYALHIPALNPQPCHQERNPPGSQKKVGSHEAAPRGTRNKGRTAGGPPPLPQESMEKTTSCCPAAPPEWRAMFMGGPNCKQGPDAGSDWTKSLVLSASFI